MARQPWNASCVAVADDLTEALAQLFSEAADRRLRIVLVLLACAVVIGAAAAFAWVRSDRAWGVGEPAPQPIPFSHAIHAGGLDLDCRYCHAGAERAASAGMPTAETCLGCHRRVWQISAQFAPLESAMSLGTPVAWASVHRLPDHVRFHHGAHAAAGIGCGACHGAVETMPRTVKAETLSMGWCLDCHRDPASRAVQPAEARRVGSVAEVEHFGVRIPALTRCSVCHR
jgi:hypothetical protein